MNDLLLPGRLQAALGDAYALERELGGGGMSRLFVATERSLNRQVVIKVLPPELSSEVSAARFKKEIEVAAQLQHPHIVPLLAAGSGDGLLWYVMPYLRGESLRHRLKAAGKLPVRDAVRILVEVADALAFAHRQGIVHRDIKPENILLEEGHAVLTDFGVARAIVAARTAANVSEGGNLTGTGMSVGTPTYMSPEQAAGESNVDARADIYALGLVGYEMLAGQHPFADSGSVQSMVVAHLTAPAPPVAKLRADTPPAVNAAIARALAKTPDERFRTAEEFRDALEAAPIGARRSRTSIVAAIAGAVAALLVIGAIIIGRRQRALPLDDNLIAVAPFDVVDADLKLWHEGIVDVLSRNLDGAGPLRTVSPTVVVRRWSGRADKESAQSLGKSTGARLTVFGSLIQSGADSVRASATVINAGSGRVLGEVERRDALSHMDRLSDSLTIGLLRELGKSRALAGAQMSSVGTTSLTALKAFLQGQQYFRRSAWDSAVAYYDRAIESDSTFSIALMYDGLAHGWMSGATDSLTNNYLQRAARFTRGLSPRDSLLAVAAGAFAEVGTARFGGSLANLEHLFGTLHEGVRRYPTDPEMWYALGDAQYHWGWGVKVGVPESEILHSFDRAIALDSAFTPAYLHSIEMGFRYGTASGRRYLLPYLAHNPTDAEADGMKLVARLTDPAQARAPETQRIIDTASVEQLLTAGAAMIEWPDSAETMARLGAPYINAHAQHAPAPDTLFRRRRVANASGIRGHVREALASQKTNQLLQVAMLAGEIPVASTDSFMYKEIVALRGCAACIVSVAGMVGDTVMVRRILSLADSLVKIPNLPVPRGAIQYTGALAQAYFTLDRRDTVAALREFLSLPDSLCHECGWSWLTRAQLLESQGRDAEAAALLDQVGVLNSPMGVLTEFERARIAEKLGDKARARNGYAFVAGMWEHGDPFFARYAADSRAALKRLSGENSGVVIPVNKH